MERKNKACWNCFHYQRYYTKGFCHFCKEKNGYCRKHGKITGAQEQCECWLRNNPRRERRKLIATKKLDEILDNIVEIKQILSEANEESKTDTV